MKPHDGDLKMVRIDRGHKTMDNSGFRAFLQLVAHEMRTPLNVISLSTRLLQAAEPGDHESVEEVRSIIESQVNVLTRIVNDVAEFSIGNTTMESVSIPDIFDDVVKTIMMSSPPHYIFEVDCSAIGNVTADPVRLKQVLLNLLNNAFKYSPPGSKICFSTVSEVGKVQFIVSDNGNGIDPQMLSHIFEPFVQDKRDQDREQGGVGLGLALVKTFVQSMNGSVEARSPGKGHGSTFIVTLPSGEP